MLTLKKIFPIFFALLISLIFSPSCSQKEQIDSRWTFEKPPLSPEEEESIRAIGGIRSDDFWAIGHGRAFHYDGKHWMSSRIQGEIRKVREISILHSKDIWGVGDHGTVLHYDGAEWKSEKLADIDYDLIHLMAWPEEVWITAAGPEYYKKTQNQWMKIKPPEFLGLHAHRIWGENPRNVFLILGPSKPKTPSNVGYFNGHHWTVTPVGLPGSLEAIHGSAPDDVWVVGQTWKLFGKGGQAHHFDGVKWTSTPLPTDVRLWNVYAVSKTEAYAVGEKGLVLRWNGSRWNIIPTGVRERLYLLSVPESGKPWVGESKTLLKF